MMQSSSTIPSAAVQPVPESVARPLWSVMIPAFNCASFLAQTLESVLAQDPGPALMHIEVVDDCSTKDDPQAVVEALGRGRVQFFRQPHNVGAITNFNTCIERSRGHLVHILHGDDYVLPGFYAKIGQAGEAHPECAAFFTRSFIVTENDELESLSNRIAHLEKPSKQPGSQFYTNDIRTPAVVVRRSFYEAHGGFLTPLVHVADWEMWLRTISLGTALMINEPLASYRSFPGNDTGRLARTGENLRDYLRLRDILAARFAKFDVTRFDSMVLEAAKAQAARFAKLDDAVAVAANHQIARDLAGRVPSATKKAGLFGRILAKLTGRSSGS